MSYPTGCLIDDASTSIRSQGVPVSRLMREDVPDNWGLEFPNIFTIQNQSPFNSCVGNALTNGQEGLFWYNTGESIAFSRWYAYITAQERSGENTQTPLVGKDEGAFISGGVKSACEDGCLPEDQFPYPSQYDPNIPNHIRELARPNLIQNFADLAPKKSRGCQRWIGCGQGFVFIGVPCGDHFFRARGGKIEQVDRQGGGHAVLLVGYKTDSQGRLWFLLMNSWGEEWGIGGYAWVPAHVVDEWCRLARSHKSEIFGITDLTGFERRTEDSVWLTDSIF